MIKSIYEHAWAVADVLYQNQSGWPLADYTELFITIRKRPEGAPWYVEWEIVQHGSIGYFGNIYPEQGIYLAIDGTLVESTHGGERCNALAVVGQNNQRLEIILLALNRLYRLMTGLPA